MTSISSTMLQQELDALVLRAAAEPIGLLLRISGSATAARNALYRAMKRQGVRLQVRTSPWPEGDLVLVNERVELSASASGSREA
jgi:hypothetical protein